MHTNPPVLTCIGVIFYHPPHPPSRLVHLMSCPQWPSSADQSSSVPHLPPSETHNIECMAQTFRSVHFDSFKISVEMIFTDMGSKATVFYSASLRESVKNFKNYVLLALFLAVLLLQYRI